MLTFSTAASIVLARASWPGQPGPGKLARAVPVRQDAQPAGSSAAALGLSSDLQSALEAFHISQLTEVQVLNHTSRPVQAVLSHVDVVPHV